MVTFSTTSAEPTVIKRESVNDKADNVKPTPKKKKKLNEKEAARDSNDNSTATTTTNNSDTEITTKVTKQQDDEKSTGVMYIFPHEKMQLNQANWYPHRLQGNNNNNWIAIGGNSGLLHLKLVQMQ